MYSLSAFRPVSSKEREHGCGTSIRSVLAARYENKVPAPKAKKSVSFSYLKVTSKKRKPEEENQDPSHRDGIVSSTPHSRPDLPSPPSTPSESTISNGSK